MNIYTPAEGLFGTHVTWEDIEADMQREFHTTASFGPNKSAKNISDCNGFMSIIALIDPDWQRKDKELPEKFVVKVIREPNLLIFNEVSETVAHFGCPAVDLVRLMSACLSGKDRREHWEELLEEFYGYLKEECGNREMPYTYFQLKESYRRFFPLGAFMIIPIIGPLFDIICKKQDEHQKQKVILKVTNSRVKSKKYVYGILTEFGSRNEED
uniref:NB-ARC domain-containing protein n=1 Tax=Angiostrongylus cantonensis TaxID=6313 RepID=A0A0K0DCY1_ANGCA